MSDTERKRSAAEVASELAPSPARLLLGDTFTHDRSGASFVCRAITHTDRDGKVRTVIELEVM